METISVIQQQMNYSASLVSIISLVL